MSQSTVRIYLIYVKNCNNKYFGDVLFRLAELLNELADFWEIIGRGSFKIFENKASVPKAPVFFLCPLYPVPALQTVVNSVPLLNLIMDISSYKYIFKF